MMSDRFPATFIFEGIEVVGVLQSRSGAPIPSQSGIDDGFAGMAQLPWYAWDKATNTYSEPFAEYTPEDFAQGHVSVNGIQLRVVNASIDSNSSVLTLKIGGRFDG